MTSSSSGLTMLTTGVSQYLHPDYLQPLPTTLDAKKSPLALLAQTCSAIGKDTSPSKPIIPPFEKKEAGTGADKPSEKTSSDSEKRPSSHGHNSKESGRDSKPGFRTFPPKDIPALVPISGSSSSDKPLSMSSSDRKSSSPSGPTGANVPSSLSSMPPSSRPPSGGHPTMSSQRTPSRSSVGKESDLHPYSSHSSHHSKPRDSPSSHRDRPTSSPSAHRPSASPSHSRAPSNSGSTHVTSSASSSSSSASLTPSSSSSAKPPVSHPSLMSGLPSPAHLAGYPNPLALMGHGLDPSSPNYHSALAAAAAAHSSLSSYTAAAAAAQSSAMKAAAAAGAPASLSPYVTYARVRTPSGASTLIPVCRDPMCSTCQLTLQTNHIAATCQQGPGCAQCAHEKSLTSLATLGLAGAPSAASSMLGLPPLSSASPLSSSMSALSSLHSLYNPHSALAAAQAASQAASQAHQGLPYVCPIPGSDYQQCAKRFATYEELLAHLRTHTPSLDASLAASYASLGLPSALAAYPHLAAPAPLSPNSLRRNYPTSLSPVSSSLLNASRYHPYKSPLSGVGATPPAPQTLPPGLGPYYSPYAIYGQRLGAAAVP